MQSQPAAEPASGFAAALVGTVERAARLLREISTTGDMSPTTAAVLSRLDRLGPTRLTELARTSGVTQPAMSQLVTRLDHDGLAARAPSPEDGRVVLVTLTDRGRDRLETRRAERRAALAEILHDVPADDRRAVAAALPALDRLFTVAAVHRSEHEGDRS